MFLGASLVPFRCGLALDVQPEGKTPGFHQVVPVQRFEGFGYLGKIDLLFFAHVCHLLLNIDFACGRIA